MPLLSSCSRSRRTARSFIAWQILVVGASSVVGPACGSDDPDLRCGDGTVQVGSACVVALGDAGGDPTPTFAGVKAVAPASASSLFVVWDPAEGGTTPPDRMRYRVFVAPSGTPIDYTAPAATTERGALGFYVGGLQAGTSYDVAVRSLDESDREDANVVVKTGVPAVDTVAPSFAGAKSAEPSGSGVVTVRWDPAQDDMTVAEGMVYLVYVGDETSDIDLTVPVVVSRPGATSAEVPGLYKGSSLYRFVVRARDAGENVDANDVTVTSRPGPDVTPPRFGGCNAAVADSAGSAIVSWTAATDDVTPPDRIAYDIFASPDEASFDYTTPAATVTDTTSTRITGLLASTAWRFVCRARDFAGNRDDNEIQRVARTLDDTTPPTFAGMTGATVDSLARTVTFTWDPASDDKTPPDQIVYDVFEARTPKGQVFDGPPRASSPPGATSFTVTDLTPDTTLYWIVRARDQGGNRDANMVEANGAIAVSFSRQVQPLFTSDCAVSGCHVPGNPMGGLVLSEGFAYDALVNVPARQFSDLRVVPSDPSSSYLYKKISQNPPPVGWQMPAPATGSVLSEQEKDMVRRWILQGAVNN